MDPQSQWNIFVGAVFRPNPRIIQDLLDQGFDVHQRQTDQGIADQTPLIIACTMSDLPTVSLLLERHADPNASNSEGNTALHEAVRSQRGPELIDLLLQYGANIESKNNKGQTALLSGLEILHANHPFSFHIEQALIKLIQLGASVTSSNPNNVSAADLIAQFPLQKSNSLGWFMGPKLRALAQARLVHQTIENEHLTPRVAKPKVM